MRSSVRLRDAWVASSHRNRTERSRTWPKRSHRLTWNSSPTSAWSVYQGGNLVYEGPWGKRDDEYDGDWYMLADVEEADIVIIDIR